MGDSNKQVAAEGLNQFAQSKRRDGMKEEKSGGDA